MSYNPTEYSRVQRFPLPLYGAVADVDAPEIVIEAIDLTAFSGMAQVQITEINGVTIADNFPIIFGQTLDVSITGSGSGVGFNITVLKDVAGTPTEVTSGYTCVRWLATGELVEPTTRFYFGPSTAVDSWFVLENLTLSNAPTIYKCGLGQDVNFGDGLYPVEEAHNGLSFNIHKSSGTVNFSSGTLILMGFKFSSNAITVEKHDFGVLSAADYVDFTLPKNATFGNVVAVGAVRASALMFEAQFGRNGTMVTGASDYAWGSFRVNGNTRTESANFMRAGGDEAAAHDEIVRLWNMNTADAHAVMEASSLEATFDHNSRRAWGICKGSTQAQNNFRYGGITATNNFTAGVIYGVFYKARTTVQELALPTGASAAEMIGGLGPLVTFETLDLDIAGTLASDIGMVAGDSGGYNSNNHSYYLHQNNAAVTSTTAANVLLARSVLTTNPTYVAGTVWGLEKSTRPTVGMLNHMNATSTSGTRRGQGFPNAGSAAVYDRLKLVRDGGGNWASGKTVRFITYATR